MLECGEKIKVEYDANGRMKYHPEFHFNQGTPWTAEDTEYLCKYHTVDDLETIAMALGRTKTTVAEKLTKLKKQGKYEYYRNRNRYW